MKTRFSPLVKIKKDVMEQCERQLQHANQTLQMSETQLKQAYFDLETATSPREGTMTDLLQSRALITVQRERVKDCHFKVEKARQKVTSAKVVLQEAMMDLEKFEYLEAEQIKGILDKQKRIQQRELDEIAVQNYSNQIGGKR